MSQSQPARVLRGALPIIAASILWGTTGTTSSLAPAATPRVAIGSAGLLFGGLLLLLTAGPVRALLTSGNRGSLLAGAVAVAGYPLTFYPAVATAGVAVATVVALGSAPVFTGLLLWFAGGRPANRWLLGTGLAIPGCAALVLGGSTGGPTHLAGILLALLAGLSYTVYAVVSGRLIGQGHASRAVLGTLFGGGALLVSPVVLVVGGPALANPRTVLVIGHLALVTTFLAYLLFGHGLRYLGAGFAVTLTLIEPAVAALLGIMVLHEQLSAVSWAGLGALGVALVLLTG